MFFHLNHEDKNNNIVGGERRMHVTKFETNIFVGMAFEVKSRFIQGLIIKTLWEIMSMEIRLAYN